MNAVLMHETACEYALNPQEETMERALNAVTPLCEMIARRFSGRGVDYEDLRQVALMACVAALQGFDPERGLKFTTYVTPTITGKVKNYLRDKGEILRTPRGLKEQMTALVQEREKWMKQYHREPSAREMAEKLDWPVEKVLESLTALENSRVSSLNAADEEGLDLESRMAVTESGFEEMENRADLKKAVAKLTDDEKKLLMLRFKQGLSQRDAARKMNLSQMQVSRYERRILVMLRKEMEGAV